MINNPAMLKSIQEGEALDVTEIGSEIAPGIYEINRFEEGLDYCDPIKDRWIWSIGKNYRTGKMYASIDTRYYCNSDYECLWLR